MILRLYRGAFHASYVRELVKLRSTKQLVIVTNLREAKAEDFAGIETIPNLERLEMRILNNASLDQLLNEQLAARKRSVAAHGRRAARKEEMARRYPQQLRTLPSQNVTRGQIDQWIREMAASGARFDPSELLNYGDVGLHAMLNQIFPETVAQPSEAATNPDSILKLIKQLESDKFEVREKATKELGSKGKSHAALLEDAVEHSDSPEIRVRCRNILNGWQEESGGDSVYSSRNFSTAWHKYLERLTDYSSDQLLVEFIVAAMRERLDLTDRAKVLGACFTPITKCMDDELYEELAKLCEHKDTAVPIFVLKRLGGRAGNSYVTPFHRAAIVSGRRELVKAGFSNMPSPVWDPTFTPFLANYYRALFRNPSQSEFATDPAFLRLQAFSAAREHNIEEARDYLIAQIDSDDTRHAVRSIYALCDTAYEQRPLDEKLRRASERLLESDEPERRIAGIQILRTYGATDESFTSLLKALEDPEEQVWQSATNALLQHQFWQKRSTATVDLSARIAQRVKQIPNERDLNKRLKMIVEILQTQNFAQSRRESSLPRWVEEPH